MEAISPSTLTPLIVRRIATFYILEADQAIKDINKALGFDESLHERMGRTNALAGMQSETGNGVRVSWDYNTNDDLEVTYSIGNE